MFNFCHLVNEVTLLGETKSPTLVGSVAGCLFFTPWDLMGCAFLSEFLKIKPLQFEFIPS